MRALSCVVLFFALVRVAGSVRADEPKADFVVDAVAWSKEYVEDTSAKNSKKAFKAKYQGKVIEVTGKVWAPQESPGIGVHVLIEGYKKPKESYGIMMVITPSKDDATKYQNLRVLAKGQLVTVRAKSLRGDLGLENCTFVKVGPSTATPFTVDGLLKVVATPAGKKKYTGTDAVVRGKVVEIKVTDDFVHWTVTDPMKKGGARLKAGIGTRKKEVRDEYAKTKVGDTIILMGEIDSFRASPCMLWDARVLKQPPDGVKLPGDKKK